MSIPQYTLDRPFVIEHQAMLIGIIVTIAGIMLVVRNKQIAVRFGHDNHRLYHGLHQSAERQNILIIGLVLIMAGLALALLP